MSLILDALRKMEQERKNRRGAAQDLRPEVLRYRPATQRKQPAKYPLVLVGVLLLCAGAGAGFLLKENRAELAASKPGQTAAPDAASAPIAQQPLAPPVAAPAPVVAPAAAPMPAPVAASGPAAPAAKLSEPLPATVEAAPPKPSRKAAMSAGPSQVESASQAKPVRESAVEVHAGNDIIISGIAYQDERRLRRAVLNGQLVGEGAEIGGARVVEIRETKVRLSRGGQLFDVPFSSGLQSR